MTADNIWFSDRLDERQDKRVGEKLSRERIVGAAIELADADPRGEATMRAIAGKLGTRSPMALYRYVDSKDGLADLMLDQMYGLIELPASADWRACLHALGRSAGDVVHQHPWFARLAFSRPPIGPNALACYNCCLAALEPLGLDAATRMGCINTVLHHVYSTGLAWLEEQAMRQRIGVDSEEELAELARPYHERIAASGQYPYYSAWAADPGRLSPQPQNFDRILDWLLNGLETTYTQ